MAKPKVTTHEFYVVDLIRNKPNLKYLVIPTYQAYVQIDVTTKGLLSASEAAKLEAKVEKLVTEGGEKGVAAAEKLIQGANSRSRTHWPRLKARHSRPIKARLKKEARARTALKWTAGAISLATLGARLVQQIKELDKTTIVADGEEDDHPGQWHQGPGDRPGVM